MTIAISYMSCGIEEQLKNSFKKAGLEKEFTHALRVRQVALQLAQQYGLDRNQVAIAALLHNIGRLIPETEYLKFAQDYSLEILPEEQKNPQLLHQKISRVLAVEHFNISDKEVLNAISCHTTLRRNASLLDKVIFLADKSCNQNLKPFTFNQPAKASNEKDLNSAIYRYLFNLLQDEKTVHTVHPWAKETLSELSPTNLQK